MSDVSDITYQWDGSSEALEQLELLVQGVIDDPTDDSEIPWKIQFVESRNKRGYSSKFSLIFTFSI